MTDAAPRQDEGPRFLRGRRLWLTALLAFLVVFGLLLYGDLEATVAALAGFPAPHLLLILGLTLAAYALRFAKWEMYLRALDIRVPLRRSLVVFASGLMMTITPGKVGEVWKAWLLERSDAVDVERVVPTVAAERVTDLLALAGLAFLGLGVVEAPYAVLGAVAAGFGVLVLVLQHESLGPRIAHALEDVPVVGGFAEEVGTAYESASRLFQGRYLGGALVLSVAAWGLEGIAMGVALQGLGLEPGWILPVAAFGLGSILGALSFLPGGLGAAEAGMVAVLAAAGIPRGEAVAATLLVRAGTLWFGALLGAAVFAGNRSSFEASPS